MEAYRSSQSKTDWLTMNSIPTAENSEHPLAQEAKSILRVSYVPISVKALIKKEQNPMEEQCK